MAVRIGITAHGAIHRDRDVVLLNEVYVEAVARAGALPLVIPVLDPARAGEVLDVLDALVLSGGGDVDPARYGEAAVPEVAGVDPDRDAWELALTHAALGRGMPVLGICRGCQVLNVACGGSLVQHLPAVSDLVHRDEVHSHQEAHPVRVDGASELAAIVGADVVGVNTLHHQAAARLGDGLRAVAWADDGTVEAIEGPPGARVLGVQWHPEILVGLPAHEALFTWIAGQAAAASSHAGDRAAAPA